MAIGDEGVSKNAREKVLVLTQEIEFAKALAGNNKRLRDRGIKKLRKWLMARSNGKCEFTDDDFLRIWKGLFYCMWMADKLLVQEELAETISNLIHCFKKTDLTISFIRCFFRTMVLEWYGIDHFRYDKFLMLIRRFLRQSFKFCRSCQWQEEIVVGICNAFSLTVLSPTKSGFAPPPLSLVLHFCDIYLQELAKVGKEKIPHVVVTTFLHPFITLLSVHENGIVRNKVVRDIFHYLMKQSDAALEFTEKWRAWKSAGCPGKSWEDMEKIEEEEEEEEEEDMYCEDTDPSEKEMLENEPLDPRAGSVNVELPQIPFDSQQIAATIQLEIEKCTSKKHCRALQNLAKKFLELAEGKYPLAKSEEKNILTKPRVEKFKLKNHINKAVFRLNSFEQKLGKRKKKSKGKNKIKKEDEVPVIEASKDSDMCEGSESMPSSSTSFERNSKQMKLVLHDFLTEPNTGTYTIYHKSRKRRNSSSSALDGDIPNLEPKLKVKKKEEIINRAKADGNSLYNSTSLMKKRASRGGWEVSDVKNDSSEKGSAEKSLLSPSGAIVVESIVQNSSTSAQNNEQKVSSKDNKIYKKTVTPVNDKKVNIALNKNCSQDLQQYQMAVKRSPAIPFDGSKQPSQGVLKPSPIGSYIDPFYRLRGRKILRS